MALNTKLLENNIFNILQNHPTTNLEVGKAWADAYHSYALGADLLVLKPTSLNKNLIPPFFVAMGVGKFIPNMETALKSYWFATPWVGSGFTGVTTSAAGFDIAFSSFANAIYNSDDNKATAKMMATAFDIYTKKIVITVTNVTTGATAVASPL